MRKGSSDTPESLLDLIDDGIGRGWIAPALDQAPTDLKLRGVAAAAEVLNIVRYAESRFLLSGAYTPGLDCGGVDGDRLDKLERELIEMGARVLTDHGDVRRELRLFLSAVYHHDQDIEAATEDVIKALTDDEREVEQNLPHRTLAALELIASGRRVCRALVGVDNRLGLLAEVNALNVAVARRKLGAAAYLRRMKAIADRAIERDGNETYAQEIQAYVLDRAHKNRPPAPKHVACMALINGVSEACSECLEVSQHRPAKSELLDLLSLSEEAVANIDDLAGGLEVDALLMMAKALRMYLARAKAEVSNDDPHFRSHLDALGVQECERLANYIQEHESSHLYLAEVVTDEVFAYVAAKARRAIDS